MVAGAGGGMAWLGVFASRGGLTGSLSAHIDANFAKTHVVIVLLHHGLARWQKRPASGRARGGPGSLFCEQEDGGDVVEAAAGVGAREERAECLVRILAEAEVLSDFGLGDHVGEAVGAE